jgi:surface antigen
MKILVNLPSLWNSATSMDSSGAQVQQTGSSLSAAGSSAPSYEGQFGPWVQGIASEANGKAKSCGSQVTDLGWRVGRKADQFDLADQSSISGTTNMFTIQQIWLKENGLLGWFYGLYQKKGFTSLLFRLFPWIFLPGFLIPRPAPGPWWRPPFWPIPRNPAIPTWPLPKPAPTPLPKDPRLPEHIASGQKPQPVQIIPEPGKPKPVPLAKTNPPTSDGSCALYAQSRRPNLGPVGNSGNGNTGAGNYIYKYKDTVFQTAKNDNLVEKIATGYALIWPIGHPQANATYGHIAIVEAVYPDHVVISQAGSPETRMELSRDFVSTLYVLP